MNDKHIKNSTVAVFDIRSSTKILNVLISRERVEVWCNLLDNIYTYLNNQKSEYFFDIYKFAGDGWILIFNNQTLDLIMDFLCKLSSEFSQQYWFIKDQIIEVPKTIGLTFGIDEGTLVKTKIGNDWEYIGSPLNVACRLQGAIKNKSSDFSFISSEFLCESEYSESYVGMVLGDKEKYLGSDTSKYSTCKNSHPLHNMWNGDNVKCIEISINQGNFKRTLRRAIP